MDIKFNSNSYCYSVPPRSEEKAFCGRSSQVFNRAGESVLKKAGIKADIFVKRPVAESSATGLFGYIKNYADNIKRTYDHKIIFGLVEKELFGRNSTDSITHDLDKLVLYTLGFPKTFVSKFHRKHSVHHVESGKKNNLRSMVCDIISSSPEFKPEKTLSIRDHYETNEDLQKVKGLKEKLEKCSYGANLDFSKIKAMRDAKFNGLAGIFSTGAKAVIVSLLAVLHI